MSKPPPIHPPRAKKTSGVRSATKSEMESRARRAMTERSAAIQARDAAVEERNAMVRRLMQNETIIAAIVAREGRIRLTAEELTSVCSNGEQLTFREMADDSLMIEILPPEPEQQQSSAPSEGVQQLVKGGLRVIEHEPEGVA